jgi:hypothetical protein
VGSIQCIDATAWNRLGFTERATYKLVAGSVCGRGMAVGSRVISAIEDARREFLRISIEEASAWHRF